MIKPTVVTISHKVDPDGIGAQAIIYRYFRELKIDPKGFLTDYHDFEEILREALNENPTILIISDIGLNDQNYECVTNLLPELQARKIWIDHHEISIEHKEVLLTIFDEFIYDTSFCAAELAYKRFMPQDKISKKIAQIGHNSDYDKSDRLSNVFYTLIDFFRNSNEKLEYIRESLVSGNFDDDSLMDDYLNAYKIFEAERDRIRKAKKTILIANNNLTYAISSILPRGKITKFLSEISNEEIVLGIDTTIDRVGLRSKILDAAAIAKIFGGGGHKHRAGFTFKGAVTTKGILSEEFVEKLEKAIQQSNKSINNET